jgi:hypothetical protein
MSLCARILVELPILEEVSCTFKKTAEGWSIGFTDDLKSYSDHDGFHYIREIIRCEGKFVDSAELRLLTAAPRPDPIQEQQLIDSGLETTGSEEYTEDDIGESLRNVNRALLEICSPENQERLLREKRWAGIKRRNDNPTGEYDRTAVRDAIESALQKIREEDPKFYDFLNPQIETGQKCRYIEEDIDSVMEWAL